MVIQRSRQEESRGVGTMVTAGGESGISVVRAGPGLIQLTLVIVLPPLIPLYPPPVPHH